MPRGSRRRARIAALQALYEGDQSTHDVADTVARHLGDAPMATDAETFVRHLVEGVQEHRSDIDRLIARRASAFPLSDMSPVDRNILRLAIYEMLFDNRPAPTRVVINEAVELAKGYGSASSGRFVNGVLGAVALEAAGATETESIAEVNGRDETAPRA